MKLWFEPLCVMLKWDSRGKFEYFHITILEFGYFCLFQLVMGSYHCMLRFLWWQKEWFKYDWRQGKV